MVAAFLYAQLEMAETIIAARRRIFDAYMAGLDGLARQGRVRLPTIDAQGTCNGHIMYIITASLEERTRLTAYLAERGIRAVFHYVPLHSSPMGKKCCRVHGEDLTHTDAVSERLLRLPLYYEMTESDVERVVASVRGFFQRERAPC